MTRQKKICFVVSSVLTAEAFLENHFKVLSRDYQIFLVADLADMNDDRLRNLTIDGYENVPIKRKISIFQDIISVYKLSMYFKRMHFDAIHSVTPKAGIISALSGWLVGVKNRIHIFTGQVWHTKRGLMKIILKLIDTCIVKLSTIIMVDGHSQRNFLISQNIITFENSIVLGKGSICGTDLKRFSPNLEGRNKVREQLNLPDSTVVFMYLGRLNKDKGILDLAQAFKKLREMNSNVYLMIVGYDEQNMVSELSNILEDGSFHFYGPASNPENLYQIAEVCCLPSYREGFGSSIIEASACGKAVVCSDTYGLLDTIIENKTGIRHPVGNVCALYEGMNLLANDKELRDSLGQNGRKFVEENFSTRQVSKLWWDFYKGLFLEKCIK